MSELRKATLSPEEWRRIRALFELCLELSADDRLRYLRHTVHATPEEIARVEALLAAAHQGASAFDVPLLAAGASVPGAAPAPRPMPLPAECGRYLLLSRLGMGGMAEVYRGKLRGPGGFEKDVAIKRVIPELVGHEEFRKLFEDEARLSASLRHPRIVEIYDFITYEDGYLLAMELIEGMSLERLAAEVRTQGRRLPLGLSLFIAREVLEGLGYVHTKCDPLTQRPLDLVHGDISPKNIMISTEGEVKLIDFGIARTSRHAEDAERRPVQGTLAYMSPEQARGSALDRLSDLYSTGAVLYELVSGAMLLNAESTYDVMRLAASPGPTVDEALRKLDAAPPVVALLAKALQSERATRFSSAADFSAAVAPLLGEDGDALRRQLGGLVTAILGGRPLPAPEPAASAGRPSGKRRLTRAALGVLALAGVAATVHVARLGPSDRATAGREPTREGLMAPDSSAPFISSPAQRETCRLKVESECGNELEGGTIASVTACVDKLGDKLCSAVNAQHMKNVLRILTACGKDASTALKPFFSQLQKYMETKGNESDLSGDPCAQAALRFQPPPQPK